jgi:hypothetical protein
MIQGILNRVNSFLIPAILLLIILVCNEAFLFQTYENDPNNFILVLVVEYLIWLALFYIFLTPMLLCYWKKYLTVKVTLINSIIAISTYYLVVFYPNYKFETLAFSLQLDHVIKMCSLGVICYLFKFKQDKRFG